MKENPPRSGAGADAVIETPWTLYNELLFLIPTLKVTPADDSLPVQTVALSDEEEQHNTNSTSVSTTFDMTQQLK